MEKIKSRRNFLKVGAATAAGIAILAGTKKGIASKGNTSENEVLYRETEHFKNYYEILKKS